MLPTGNLWTIYHQNDIELLLEKINSLIRQSLERRGNDLNSLPNRFLNIGRSYEDIPTAEIQVESECERNEDTTERMVPVYVDAFVQVIIDDVDFNQMIVYDNILVRNITGPSIHEMSERCVSHSYEDEIQLVQVAIPCRNQF